MFKPITRKCRYCQNEFTITDWRKNSQRYCSPECYKKAENIRKLGTPEWVAPKRNCALCGKPLVVTKTTTHIKYHPECKLIVHRKESSEWRKKHPNYYKRYTEKKKAVPSPDKPKLSTKRTKPTFKSKKRRRCKAVSGGMLEKHARGCNGFCTGENRFYSASCHAAILHRGERWDGDWVYAPNLAGITGGGELDEVSYDKL